MTFRILVVDDEPIVREVLSRYLAKDGFVVDVAEDGQSGLDMFNDHGADLVLLDLMMPKLDGFQVFERIRSSSDTPVIMLTARREEQDRIAGLRMGADDYVSKPFSPGEVVARVRAVLRRSEPVVREEAELEFDGIRIDPRSRRLFVDEQEVSLTPREFDLLVLMASNAEQVFTRLELLEELWDFAFYGDPATVTVHIRRLREKIERDPSAPRHIITVWGSGYRFDP